ncbi:esterase/lipase family protein [Saccharothrix deserti]|uniref:esterase/lipase family protein n=1 Tax=Saccharothrix deserti TaxID=2593674 RepID=UPI00131E7EE8|nr:alpha/beta fold hydrolase [Saccharothrix deserti]
MTPVRSRLAAVVLVVGVLAGQAASPGYASADSDPPAGPPQSDIRIAQFYSWWHPTASPAGANDWACRTTPRHPRPVVLVLGTGSNAYYEWARMAPVLRGEGYCVFAPNVGGRPGSPVQAVGPIAETARQFAVFVDRVLAATGASKVDVVGHSQGGVVARYHLKYLGGREKVDALIGLAPANRGTTVHGLLTLITAIPLTSWALGVGCPACVELERGSRFMAELNSGGMTYPEIDYTVIITNRDIVVSPYRSSFLPAGPNVRNTLLQDVCPHERADHVDITYSAVATRLVLNALDPGSAVPPDCGRRDANAGTP